MKCYDTIVLNRDSVSIQFENATTTYVITEVFRSDFIHFSSSVVLQDPFEMNVLYSFAATSGELHWKLISKDELMLEMWVGTQIKSKHFSMIFTGSNVCTLTLIK